MNLNGGCAATNVGAITATSPQGMAVENDPVTGNGLFLFYVADSPGTTPATVMRFHPNTGLQDIVSTTVTPPYDSLLTPGTTVSTYTSITGLAVNPHSGDLFIGDDPTATLVNPPTNKGHLFTIKGVSGVAPANCVGTIAAPCVLPSRTGPRTGPCPCPGARASSDTGRRADLRPHCDSAVPRVGTDLLAAVHRPCGRTDQRHLEDPRGAIREADALPREPVRRAHGSGVHRQQGRLHCRPEHQQHHFVLPHHRAHHRGGRHLHFAVLQRQQFLRRLHRHHLQQRHRHGMPGVADIAARPALRRPARCRLAPPPRGAAA